MADPRNPTLRPWLLVVLGIGMIALSLLVGVPAITSGTFQARGWRLEGPPAVAAGAAVVAAGVALGAYAVVAAVRRWRAGPDRTDP